jgi:hypothetical protein
MEYPGNKLSRYRHPSAPWYSTVRCSLQQPLLQLDRHQEYFDTPNSESSIYRHHTHIQGSLSSRRSIFASFPAQTRCVTSSQVFFAEDLAGGSAFLNNTLQYLDHFFACLLIWMVDINHGRPSLLWMPAALRRHRASNEVVGCCLNWCADRNGIGRLPIILT